MALRQALAAHVRADYGVAPLAFAVLALLVVGGYPISHLAFLGSDPVVLRFCGLRRLGATTRAASSRRCAGAG